MALHCALAAGRYDVALTEAQAGLTQFPDNPLMQRLVRRLTQNDRVEELVGLFSRVGPPRRPK